MHTHQKGFAPILIILLVLLVTATGYFVYVTNFKSEGSVVEQTTPTHTKTPASQTSLANTISQLTKEQVLNGYDACGTQFKDGNFSIGWEEAERRAKEQGKNICDASSGFSADAITFADLDADGFNEAVVSARIVRASSGGVLYVFKNINGAAHVIAYAEFGKENGEIVSVNQNTIVIETDGAMGYTPHQETYKFINGKLVQQK
jgi:hypothetical protein